MDKGHGHWYFLYTDIKKCRINHSCLPNSHHQWNSEDGEKVLYCTENLQVTFKICHPLYLSLFICCLTSTVKWRLPSSFIWCPSSTILYQMSWFAKAGEELTIHYIRYPISLIHPTSVVLHSLFNIRNPLSNICYLLPIQMNWFGKAGEELTTSYMNLFSQEPDWQSRCNMIKVKEMLSSFQTIKSNE